MLWKHSLVPAFAVFIFFKNTLSCCISSNSSMSCIKDHDNSIINKPDLRPERNNGEKPDWTLIIENFKKHTDDAVENNQTEAPKGMDKCEYCKEALEDTNERNLSQTAIYLYVWLACRLTFIFLQQM